MESLHLTPRQHKVEIEGDLGIPTHTGPKSPCHAISAQIVMNMYVAGEVLALPSRHPSTFPGAAVPFAGRTSRLLLPSDFFLHLASRRQYHEKGRPNPNEVLEFSSLVAFPPPSWALLPKAIASLSESSFHSLSSLLGSLQV